MFITLSRKKVYLFRKFSHTYYTLLVSVIYTKNLKR